MNTRILATRLLVLVICCSAHGLTHAAETTDEIAALRAQLLALTSRMDELERSNAELRSSNLQLAQTSSRQASTVAKLQEQARTSAAPATAPTASWTDTIRWQGDFRYRFESLDQQHSEERNRNRIRARAALLADINEDMEVGIGLASGGLDPVSSNQTLGGGGTKKEVAMDLAYFAWTGLANTRVVGGKFKQIVYTAAQNQLLWDSDWRPEGAGIRWDGERFFATGLGTWIEGDSNRDTEFSWIAQAGLRLALGDASEFTTGLGLHQFDTRGRSAIIENGEFYGNSFDPVTGTYLYNYEGLQAFAELRSQLFGLPITAYGEYVQNQDAPVNDQGYIVGLQLGSAKAPGSWDLGWAWEDLEADATFGLLSDSDFGVGGTDVRGHVFKGNYLIRTNFSTQITYYLTEVGENRGAARDVDRLQLDLSFKF